MAESSAVVEEKGWGGGSFPRELTVFNYFGNLWPIEGPRDRARVANNIKYRPPPARREGRRGILQRIGENVWFEGGGGGGGNRGYVVRGEIKWCFGGPIESISAGQVAATGNYYLRT